jgi:hypothetical protein
LLVDLVYQPPATTVHALQHKGDVLVKSGDILSSVDSNFYLVPEAVCEESAISSTRPAVDVDDESGLDSVSLRDKNQVVARP